MRKKSAEQMRLDKVSNDNRPAGYHELKSKFCQGNDHAYNPARKDGACVECGGFDPKYQDEKCCVGNETIGNNSHTSDCPKVQTEKPAHAPILFLTLHDSQDFSQAVCGCILERREDGEGSNYLRCEKCVRAVNAHEKMKELMRAYFKIHDVVSDLIERGALTEGMIPDDYQAMVVALEAAAIIGTDPAIREVSREAEGR